MEGEGEEGFRQEDGEEEVGGQRVGVAVALARSAGALRGVQIERGARTLAGAATGSLARSGEGRKPRRSHPSSPLLCLC